MDFVEYIEAVAKKLKDTADKDEYFRLVVVLRDTCNSTIKKLQAQK
jgi:hypothetical protein